MAQADAPGSAPDGGAGEQPPAMPQRVRALEAILARKGYVDPAALDGIVAAHEHEVGPQIGARVVARAWADPPFRRALLADATAAVDALGVARGACPHLIAVENTARRHNLVVCTLCSCYPWDLLGLPPEWYKSAPYRSRAVLDPRGVLADFGLALPAGREVRVWDSTAEVRYLVLPLRPEGTAGWDEAALAALVTRDSMIGTGLARRPPDGAR